MEDFLLGNQVIIDNFWIFLLYNLLTVLVIGVIYFFVKEIYRVKSNYLSKSTRLLVGSFLGILALILLLSINFMISEKAIYNGSTSEKTRIYAFLNPAMIILILFPLMIDRRLAFPILLFIIIGILVKAPLKNNSELEFDIFKETSFWTRLIFTIGTYLTMAIIAYFLDNNNIFKNNGIKLIFILFIWLIITGILRIMHSFVLLSYYENLDITNFITIEAIIWGKQFAYLLVIAFISFVPVYIIERVYANFNTLETFATKDDVSYYRMSLAQNKLKQLIDEKKINQGALVLFEFKVNEEDISKILKEIKYQTEIVYSGSFFFKATSQHYAAFLPLEYPSLEELVMGNKLEERNSSDSLFGLDSIITKINRNFKAKIFASTSIYGVHSYDLNDLIEYSRFTLTPVVRRSNINNIVVYDFKRVKDRLKERNKVLELPINIETMSLTYLKGVNKEHIYYPSVSFNLDGKKNSFNSLFLSNIPKQILEDTVRYIAYQSLRTFDKSKSTLVIYYPYSYLASSSFNLINFNKKINRYSRPEKIIIGVFLNSKIGKKQYKENIEKLRELGYRVALINMDNLDQENHNLVNPDFILDLEEQTNPLKIKKKKLNYKSQATRLNTNLV